MFFFTIYLYVYVTLYIWYLTCLHRVFCAEANSFTCYIKAKSYTVCEYDCKQYLDA